eukprot:3933637-Rhodomonas_salina.1
MSFTIRLRLRRRAPPASAANCAAALLFRFFFADCQTTSQYAVSGCSLRSQHRSCDSTSGACR